MAAAQAGVEASFSAFSSASLSVVPSAPGLCAELGDERVVRLDPWRWGWSGEMPMKLAPNTQVRDGWCRALDPVMAAGRLHQPEERLQNPRDRPIQLACISLTLAAQVSSPIERSRAISPGIADLEEPLTSASRRFHLGARAPALAVDHLLVWPNGHVTGSQFNSTRSCGRPIHARGNRGTAPAAGRNIPSRSGEHARPVEAETQRLHSARPSCRCWQFGPVRRDAPA